MVTPTRQHRRKYSPTLRSRRPYLRIMLSSLLIVLLSHQGLAQQAPSIADLKTQISQMEQVDRDPTVSEDVKKLNVDFLKARRLQLQDLLTRKIDGLRKYRSDLSASLSATEKQGIDNAIQEAENDLAAVKTSLGVNTSVEAATNGSGVHPNGNGSSNGVSSSTDSGTSNTGGGQSTTSNTSAALTATPVAPQSGNNQPTTDCYPGAPQILTDTASGAAFRVARDGGGSITLSLSRLIFFTIADALSSVEKDRGRREVIRSIRIRQFMEETKRTDKQTGASATSEGSTSALEKPNFANLLALAIEHGAIDKEISGTTLTLSSSPYAFIAAANGDTSTTYKKYEFFNRIGVSANFNIENENDVLASARRNQLSEWSVRARFTPDRSVRSAEFEDFWNSKVRDVFERVPLVLVNEFSDLFRDETNKVRKQLEQQFIGYGTQYLTNNPSLSDEAKRAGLQQLYLCKLKQDVFDKIDSFGLTETDKQRIVTKTLPALSAAIEAEGPILKLIDDKIEEMNNRQLATFAYTNKRDPLLSDYSILKFLYEKKTFSPMKIVANGGLSLYHKPNHLLNQQTVRDINFAVSLEGRAGRSPFVMDELDQSQITFALTGRYERMFENRGIPGRKADLGFFQFRVEVPFMDGMSFPFSVTYANATELIKEDHVRANFGFSFDADKLFFLKTFLRR